MGDTLGGNVVRQIVGLVDRFIRPPPPAHDDAMRDEAAFRGQFDASGIEEGCRRPALGKYGKVGDTDEQAVLDDAGDELQGFVEVLRLLDTPEVAVEDEIAAIGEKRFAAVQHAHLDVALAADVGGKRGDQIRHVWKWRGRRMQTIALRVGSSQWRTFSTKTLNSAGVWTVEAHDTSGAVLASAEFVAGEG